MRFSPIFLSAAAIVLALSACTQAQIRGAADRASHDMAFDTITATDTIPPGPAGLTALDLFLARNGATYGDRLVIAAPAATLDRLAQRYAALGVRVLSAPDAPDRPDGGPFQVTFSRLVVTPPACSDWSDAQAYDNDNQPAPNWGCATASNLARMVADPHDLQAGRAGPVGIETAADTVAINAYRAGRIEVVTVQGDSATTGD